MATVLPLDQAMEPESCHAGGAGAAALAARTDRLPCACSEGGQAMIAGQIRHHAGAGANGESSKQSHATRVLGESTTLPGQDPHRDGAPIPSRSR